jgi:hypothetical protein
MLLHSLFCIAIPLLPTHDTHDHGIPSAVWVGVGGWVQMYKDFVIASESKQVVYGCYIIVSMYL